MDKKILDKIEEFNRKKLQYKEKNIFFGGKAFIIMAIYFFIMIFVLVKYEEKLSSMWYVMLLFPIGFAILIMFMALSDDKNSSINKKTETEIKKENNKLLNKMFSESDLLKICKDEIDEIKEIIANKISNGDYGISIKQQKNNIKVNINIHNTNIYYIIDEKIKKVLGVCKENFNEKIVDQLIKKEISHYTKKSKKTLEEILKNINVNYNFPYGKFKGNETSEFYRNLYGVIYKYKNKNKRIEKFNYSEIYNFTSEQFSNYKFNDDIEKEIFISINSNIIKEETKEWIHSINHYVDESERLKEIINSRNPHEYENHCWNCHAHIDSKVNSRCLECGWYICDQCGACSVSNHKH